MPSASYCFGTVPLAHEMFALHGWIKGGPPPRQDKQIWGFMAGILATEVTHRPASVGIFPPAIGDRNQGFSSISCQVFPLLPTAKGRRREEEMKFHGWMHAGRNFHDWWLARTAAAASLLAFLPPHSTIRKMDPHIIATCWTRLAVDDARSLGKLASERSEQRLLAWMPWLGGHNASAVRADVAGEGPFGSPRFLRSCKVHRNFYAMAPLDPSVGKQRGVPPRWSGSIHGVYPFAVLQAAGLTTSMPPCWLQTMRKNPYFSCREIPEKEGKC